MMTMNDEQ